MDALKIISEAVSYTHLTLPTKATVSAFRPLRAL